MKKTTYLLFLLVFFSSVSIFAQRYTISGTVKDAATGEVLIGASVTIPSLSTGAMAGADGTYRIENIPAGTYEFAVSYIGYTKLTKNLRVAGDLNYNFVLENSGILLQETVVKGTRATLRETPVAFSEVSGKDIEVQLASRDLPMVLTTTPSVYTSLNSGGAGDANMVVRGFDQKNIAVMINGVPVNDMEGKSVYWSNWAGLGDVTEDIQIVRGIGSSPYAVNAVGGLVNVRTKGIGSVENMYKFRYEMGSYGLQKTQATFSQRIGGFAVTGLISRKTQEGYVRQTYLDEWTYYIGVGGVFGAHSLELQAIGSPQEHGQRSTNAKIADWEKYGKDWNGNAGRLNGGWYVDAINKYHKPAFNLNWNWSLGKNTTLATVFYFSPGRGWGTGTFGNSVSTITTGEFAGYRDYDKVYTNNRKTDNTYSTAAYGTAGQYRALSVVYTRENSHDWGGLVSTFKTILDPTLTLTVGLDARLYKGMHFGKIKDLVGGDYFVEVYKNGTSGNINNPINIARIGDKINYDYVGYVRNLGGFGQLEYKGTDISAFVNFSAATVGNKREDFFNYTASDPLRESEWVNFFAYTIKTGLNYNLDDNNSAFANFGFFETPPTLSSIFVGYSSPLANTKRLGTVNEKVLLLELGYQYATTNFVAKINGFYTKWQDRALTTSYTDPVTKIVTNQNLLGASQLHQGVELELDYRVLRGLDLKVIGSLLSAKYQNDVNAEIVDQNGLVKGSFFSYVEGLYVANMPMQILAASFNYNLNIGYGINIFVNPEYKFYGKQYANFSADARKNLINGVPDRAQSWQVPDYSLLDLRFGTNVYFTDFLVKNLRLTFNIFNVLDNTDYIQYANESSSNTTHTADQAYVYFGRPRFYNLSLTVGF